MAHQHEATGNERQALATQPQPAPLRFMALRDWLAEHAVTVVGMESTGAYWKPIYYLLEDDFGSAEQDPATHRPAAPRAGLR